MKIGERRRFAYKRDHEEITLYAAGKPERVPLVIFCGDDDEVEEAQTLMRQGLVCASCGEALVDAPSIKTVEAFRSVLGHAPADFVDAMLRKVAMGCCPYCGFEVTPEMTGLQNFKSYDDAWKPRK